MQRSHPFISVALAVAVALAVLAAIGLLSRRGTERQVQPTPPPGIRAVATDVLMVPKTSGPRKHQIVTELRRALARLYRTAFVATDVNASPAPSPKPEDRLRPFFTRAAWDTLVHHRGLFRLQPGLTIHSGRIAFSGVVTLDGNTPIQALFDADFLAVALPSSDAPDVRVHQKGTMSLVRVNRRWFVDGFDLRFATKPIPTPTPENP